MQLELRQSKYAYIVLSVLALLAPAHGVGATLFSDDFRGRVETHWTAVDDLGVAVASSWSAEEGLLRPTGDAGGARSTYLLTGNSAWTDYRVSMRLQARDAEARMGLVFGYSGPGNYYVFSIDGREAKHSLSKSVNGVVTIMAEDRAVYEKNKWYTVEARLRAGIVEVRIDDSQLYRVVDVSHVSGKVGLYGVSNSNAVVDELVVTTDFSESSVGKVAEAGCQLTITPTAMTVGPKGDKATATVSGASGCNWITTSQASWINVTYPSSGSGSGKTNFSIQANSGSTPREGKLTIGGVTVNVTQLAAGAPNVFHVPPGANLQKALDQAEPGDTIALQAGAVYSGYFFLRKKPGSGYITITTTNPGALPPAGSRITPAHANGLPKVSSPNASPVFRTDEGASRYRLIGLEITSTEYNWDLIRLGSLTASSVTAQSSDFVLDRLYIHGHPVKGAKRGITLNTVRTSIVNCYISDIKAVAQETQAIGGWNGPGPYEIVNNYLEAAGENVMFGGAPAKIPGLVPSDIVIKRNHFTKQPSWRKGHPANGGKLWTVKNILELKNARRVTIEGNVFEHNWQQGQTGYAIVLTPRTEAGKMKWAVVEDILFVRNVIRRSGAGVNILGTDGQYGGKARRITFKDNIFEEIDYKKWSGEGRLFQVLQGPEDLTIDHNTFVSNNVKAAVMFAGTKPAVRFVYKNNILPHGDSGVFGSGSSTGATALKEYAPGHVFVKNVLAGAPSRASAYPSGSFFPSSLADVKFVSLSGGDFRLSSSSPYLKGGTDGADIGANVVAVKAATAAAGAP
jgi:hypothetical protein